MFLCNCVKRPWQYGAVSEDLSSFLSRGFTSNLAYDFYRHNDRKFRINGGEWFPSQAFTSECGIVWSNGRDRIGLCHQIWAPFCHGGSHCSSNFCVYIYISASTIYHLYQLHYLSSVDVDKLWEAPVSLFNVGTVWSDRGNTALCRFELHFATGVHRHSVSTYLQCIYLTIYNA